MSTPSHGSPPPLTTVQIEEWITTAHTKHGELHLLATEPLYSTLRDQAVLQMSKLLQEAIEKVRVVSASLREERQAVRPATQSLTGRRDGGGRWGPDYDVARARSGRWTKHARAPIDPARR